MAELFQLKEEGSRSKLNSVLQSMRAKGQSIMDKLSDVDSETLIELERRLSAINFRQHKANRVRPLGTTAKFVATDFIDIDQTQTTATVRVDSESATLRERLNARDVVIKTKSFSSSTGTVEAIGTTDPIYRVHSDRIPTGQFLIELLEPISVSLLVFDIVATPSQPSIVVKVSPNDVVYTDASEISLNGYRINAWFNPVETKFVRIEIVPTHSDTISGATYSFGITDFAATGVDYHLRSEVVSKPINIQPKSDTIHFKVDDISGANYFLSVASGSYSEIVKDSDIILSGVTKTSVTGTSVVSTGLLGTAITSDCYIGTIQVTENRVVSGVNTPVAIPIAPGLAPEFVFSNNLVCPLGITVRPTVATGKVYRVITAGTTQASTEPSWPSTVGTVLTSGTAVFVTESDVLNHLVQEYIAVFGTSLYLVPITFPITTSRVFNVSFYKGPSSISLQVKVKLSTLDRAISPVFHNLAFEEK
jgi:hypothetical protein